MKVTINLEVDIDPEAWIAANGRISNPIADDVREFVQDLVREHLQNMEVTVER